MSKHAVSTLIFRNENEGLERMEVLLVCENANRNDKDAWRWQLPGGRCCEGGEIGCCLETPEETVARECAEEAGYQIKAREVISVQNGTDRRSGKQFLRYFYRGEIVGGYALEKKVFGTISPRWFLVTKLPRNMFSSHMAAVRSCVMSMVAENLREAQGVSGA